MKTYGGIKLYFAQNPTDNTEFYIYADSNLTRDNSQSEYRLRSYLRANYPTELQTVDELSTSLTTNSGGTSTDGKIRFLLKI